MLKINSVQSLTLDIIRIFAVQIVVVGHLLGAVEIGDKMPYIQNTGVVIFFVLSGLIISYTLFYKSQSKAYSFKIFFIDRFSRIYMGLLPSLLVILIIDSCILYLNPEYYTFQDAFNLKTFFGNLFMLQDYNEIGYYLNQYIPLSYKITSFGSGRPLWTLSIEWWLYLFFGLVYFFYRKRFFWKYFPLLVLFSIVPIWHFIYGNILTVYWFLGVLITLLVFKNKQNFSSFFLLSLSSMFFFAAIINLFILEHTAYSPKYVIYLAGSLFFLLLYQQHSKIDMNEKIMHIIKYIASYSFTLYLIHYSIIVFILSFNLSYDKFSLFIFIFLISNIIALLVASIGEMQYRKVSEKIKKYWK